MRLLCAITWPLVFVVSLSSCEPTQEKLVEREESTQAQRAIEKYSGAVDRLEPHLEQFVESWVQAVATQDATKMVQMARSKAIPALEKHLLALKNMPTESEALLKIHGILVGAVTELLAGIQQLVSDLRPNNRLEPIAAFRDKLLASAAGEKKYQDALKAYYEKHQVRYIASNKPGPTLEVKAPARPSQETEDSPKNANVPPPPNSPSRSPSP